MSITCPWPASARRIRSWSAASARSRPTKGLRVRASLLANGDRRGRAPTTREAVTGALLPRISIGPIGSRMTSRRTSCAVASLTRIVPGSAACWRRAAGVVGSPTAGVVHTKVVADGADDHGPRVQSHAHGDRACLASEVDLALPEDALDRERGEDTSANVILVGQWRTEQGHEPVAKELVDRALVSVHLAQR